MLRSSIISDQVVSCNTKARVKWFVYRSAEHIEGIILLAAHMEAKRIKDSCTS